MATVYFNSPQLACFFFGADGNGCTHQAGELSFCTCGKRSAMDALEVDFKNPAADDLWLKTACCCYHCGFNFGEGLCAIRRGSNCCWGCLGLGLGLRLSFVLVLREIFWESEMPGDRSLRG